MAEKDQAILRVVNYASVHKSKGRGKPASLVAAKEEAITLWEYLEDNPEIQDKLSIPEDRFALVADYKFACPLCAVFYARKCKGCPLRFEKSPEYARTLTCKSANHVYAKYMNATNVDDRKARAHEIVEAIKAWNPEEV